MRLLDVWAVLDRERDIKRAEPKTKVLEDLDDKTAKYAILSHRWGREVDYDEMTGLIKLDEHDRDEVRRRDGYKKIIKGCKRAKRDGYRWLWIDTCCIDKQSSAELSEAINSMYRWYRNSQKCYVYLNDVGKSAFPTKQDFSKLGRSNGWPEWFSRGWTLQELIAPKEVEFFNKRWVSIGTKQNLTSTIEEITRIPKTVLRGVGPRDRPCIAQIMSWAADRRTTRVEDRAYSLLGLFNVNMPLLYGEGSNAFRRLQLEIIRASSDHSIFAWNQKRQLGKHGSVLADDPSCFRGCHDVERVHSQEFVEELEVWMHLNGPDMDTDQGKLESLGSDVESPQLFRFDVTNLGIQVSLPVLPYRDSRRYFQAILPCRDHYGNLITINLEDHGLNFGRAPSEACVRHTRPEFRSLYLDCSQDDDLEKSPHDLRLHDRRASYYGFTRCGTFPCDITGNIVTLSQGNTLIVLVYANDDVKSRFAVGLGYYLGQKRAHIICDECPANQEVWSSWVDFAKQTYDILWDAPLDESCFDTRMIKDAHLPRSIWDARIVCHRSELYVDSSDVMIDIQQCPGCCWGPRQNTDTSAPRKLWLPWKEQYYPFRPTLELDGQTAWLDECFRQRVALGDYGNASDGILKCRGNIFEDMQGFGIDPTDSVYRPVVSRVSSYTGIARRVQAQHVIAMASDWSKRWALYEPKGLSLPTNEEFELLLKALSTRLAGNHLVTTVIQCSKFYEVDRVGRGMGAGGLSNTRSTNPSTFTVLCTYGIPLAWHKEPACEQRKEQFKNIREHFYVLANLHHLAGTESRHESADEQEANGVVDFSAVFGLEHLKKFVGEITFFDRLPSIMENRVRSKGSVGTTGGNGSTSVHPSNSPFNSRHEVVAPILLQKCKVLGKSDQSSLCEKRNMQHEVKSISQTLSVGLLKHVYTTLFSLNAFDDNRRTNQEGHTDHNTANVYSTIQEVEALQAKLQETEDKDEQRALEEDITGKVLWFHWRGICSEVDQLLVLLVNHVQTKRYHYDQGSREIAKIIKRTLRTVALDDDIAHLQRVMLDAGAGISRHELWLSAQATDQARLPKVLRGKPMLSTQETGSNTSPEASPASIVQPALDTGHRKKKQRIR